MQAVSAERQRGPDDEPSVCGLRGGDVGEVLSPTGENLRPAAAYIADGGVVVAPSDTNLALTVDPWHADAIDRVYEMTGRPVEKPLTLFARDPADYGSSASTTIQTSWIRSSTRSGRDRWTSSSGEQIGRAHV